MMCSQCHSENPEGAKFCNECGLPLVVLPAQDAPADNEFAEAEDAASDEKSDDAERVADAEEDSFESESDAADGGVLNSKADPIKPNISGSLTASMLPVIDVAGVNVDEDGNAFDFSPLDDELDEQDDLDDAFDDEADESLDEDTFDDEADESLLSYVPSRPTNETETSGETDFSGIDECLADSSYTPPQVAWRSGDTLEMPRIEGQPEPKQRDFKAPDPQSKKGSKGKVFAIMLACLLVFAAAGAGFTYYLEMWGGKMLPNVVGMTQTDAVDMLEAKGFSVRSTQVKSDETEGVVLLMDPGAGARQEEGTEVVVHVSVARTVPEVVGTQRDAAAAQLEEDGFDNVVFAVEKSNEHEGMVLSVVPEAGTKAKATTPVTVTVAEPYMVPDISGMSWDDAVAAIEGAGFVAQTVYVYDDKVKEGTLVGIDPAAGTKLASGSTVTVSLSKSRSSELVAAAQSYLASVGSLSINGADFVIEEVKSVSYQGSDTTAFTVQGYAVTTADVLGEAVSVSGSKREASGSIVWDSANNVVSVSLS